MTPSPFEEAKALHRAGDLDRAAELYRAAIAADPGDFRAHHNLGVVFEATGDAAAAESAYRRALEANPDAAWSHYNLARLRHLAGRLDEADAGYRRALELEPELAEAHFNLGRLLLERGEPAQAEAALRRHLDLVGEDAHTESYLGDALFAQQRVAEALEAYGRTAALEPADAAAHFDVGKSLQALHRVAEAIERYRRCVALDPLSAAAREALARALHEAGRTAEAVAEVREWLSLAPDQPVARHLLAALGAAQAPARASDAYVKETFDRFAADFDRTLERLSYRAPDLIAAALVLALGEPRGLLDVLDLGCGTGLCALRLRPWARRLEGVDLSGAMLERARRRGIYDGLHEGELTRFLAGYLSSWDVIAGADTLCYFGALEPALKPAARALREGGVIVFTVELLAEGSAAAAGFALQPHGRFAHRADYVSRALAACGFRPTLVHAALRTEGGHEVPGLVAVGFRL